MKVLNKKRLNRDRRHKRVRARVAGTADVPRLAVFRSNRFLYAQLIDDEKGETILSFSTKGQKGGSEKERVAELGKQIADAAKTKKISKLVFDRGGFLYSGKIKDLADAVRKGGLNF